MEFKELKNKTEEELKKILSQYRESLREMRFKVAQRQLKNVREIREIKAVIARILTILNQRESK